MSASRYRQSVVSLSTCTAQIGLLGISKYGVLFWNNEKIVKTQMGAERLPTTACGSQTNTKFAGRKTRDM
jgi:hypothetical protein